jgi:transposase InsO family protein
MKELGLQCKVRLKKYKSYKGEEGETAPNLLNRDFTAAKPNQKWVTDVTEFKMFGSKIYLSPILDLYDMSVISYVIAESPTFAMVTDMVEQAVVAVPEEEREGLIMHSDQGWHYRHKQYRKLMEENHITQSMSRKGNCYDNAVVENFFGILKTELLYLQKFESPEHFKSELIDWLDYYNNRRTKEKLFDLAPSQFRRLFSLAA